ncbi:signal transducer and activator of transcription 2 isoform 2-T2 [Synchiropus picturatus]
MAQWEKMQQLPAMHTQRLHGLYDRDHLPMDVRHYLAAWIEMQDWQRAARDLNLASVLFQGLLENLDIQHSRFVQDKSFVMQHNIRRHKQSLQVYQEDPCTLAGTIFWFLEQEKDILRSAELPDQIQMMRVCHDGVGTSSQQDLERKLSALKNDVQCMDHTMNCLEDQQDEFDFKYQTHLMEVGLDEKEKTRQQDILKSLINKLNECRKRTLADLSKLLDKAEDLIKMLVTTELVDWQRRQQKACIGAPENVCLDQMEKWFTSLAVCLFQVRGFLGKLDELKGKVTYSNDPIVARKPGLLRKTEKLLRAVIKSSFVVETQPSMPQGKGPLVLRTNVQFSVKARLLVKIPELNQIMKVEASMDRGAPKTKGYRHFNVLGTRTKTLNIAEMQCGGMVADFRHLNLKEQKSSGGGKGTGEISLSVTEELHILYFNTVFQYKDFSVDLETTSLPVVIISNASQQQNAWASILWFNMLSQDTKDILFFANCPPAPWQQFAEMLSWQFLSATKRGLDETQLEMIAIKIFGKQSNPNNCSVSWSKFCKENIPETFFVWFDGILVMVKEFLEHLWNDGLIMGFVSKESERVLLKDKVKGTFLLRFSESVIGGVTFSWLDRNFNGLPEVKTVQPFTKNDLKQIPFQEILRNFQFQEVDNVPENPLLYLYPDIPKDDVLGKFYSEKTGDDSPYIKYIKTKLMFVSKENSSEAMSPMSCDMIEGEGLSPFNGPFEEAAGQDQGTPDFSGATYNPDPMLATGWTTDDDAVIYPSILPDFADVDTFNEEPLTIPITFDELCQNVLDGVSCSL